MLQDDEGKVRLDPSRDVNMVHQTTIGHHTPNKNFEKNLILRFEVFKLGIILGSSNSSLLILKVTTLDS